MAKEKAYRSSKDEREETADTRPSSSKTTSKKRKKTRLNGTIKWYKSRRGFGFITPEDETADELFFDKDGLKDEDYKPKKGERVAYTFAELEKGPAAIEIERLSNR